MRWQLQWPIRRTRLSLPGEHTLSFFQFTLPGAFISRASSSPPTTLPSKDSHYPIAHGVTTALAKVSSRQVGAGMAFAPWRSKAEPELLPQSCATFLASRFQEKKMCVLIFFLASYHKCEQQEII